MPTILGCLLLLSIWILYQKSRSEKSQKEESKAFWDQENKANSVRRKDLSDLNYIQIPFDLLPFIETKDKELSYVQENLQALRDQKTVNLSNITNTELKLTYGTANIIELTKYDQNFTLLIRYLHKWGSLLSDSMNIDAAITVLSYAVSIDSDISGTYVLLATHYAEKNQLEEISSLITRVDSLHTVMKSSIQSQLNLIYEKASHALE